MPDQAVPTSRLAVLSLAFCRKAIILYMVCFSVLMVFAIPPLETPDEQGHLDYVSFILSRHKIPNQYVESDRLSHGHYHPLYYAVCAALISPLKGSQPVHIQPIPNTQHCLNGGNLISVPLFKNTSNGIFKDRMDRVAFYVLRLFSVFLGALNLWLIARASIVVFGDRWESLVPVLLAGMLPQFLFVSASINDDNLANLLSTLTIYLLLQLVQGKRSLGQCIGLGAALGLGLLAKKTLGFLVPSFLLIGGYLVLREWRATQRVPAVLVRNLGAALLTTIVVCGWWFARNYALYGDVLASQMEQRTFPFLVQKKSLLDPFFVTAFPRNMYSSYIGLFGWMNVVLPSAVYYACGGLLFLCVVGLFKFLRRREESRQLVLVSLTLAGVCLAAIIYFNLTYSQAQGRYLFPAISAISIVLGAGLVEWLSRAKLPVRNLVAAEGLLYCLVALDVFSLIRIIRFYYVV